MTPREPRPSLEPASTPWRRRLFAVIFEADTPAGKAFDIALLLAIVVSVVAVMLESVAPIEARYGQMLRAAEWAFTLLFTIEYGLRLSCVHRPRRYALSFFGIVDLLAIVPTYLSVLVPGAQSLLVIRGLRLLRMFRVLKLGRYLGEAELLRIALHNARPKISVFIFTVLIVVTIVGAAMYLIEGPRHGFTSIPMAVYWAIVTMTTVGFGDITPHTAAGRILASVLMVLGYGIIAVPTGIVTVELTDAYRRRGADTRTCSNCRFAGHDADAAFCKRCGAPL